MRPVHAKKLRPESLSFLLIKFRNCEGTEQLQTLFIPDKQDGPE